MKLGIAGVIVLVGLAGCASGGNTDGVVATATDAQKASLLGKLKALEGEWVGADPHSGEMITACIFKTSSGGTTVREIMFPGAAHEMTNMYHMDGDSLIVTHYCAMGNQPRMRASSAAGNTIEFKFDSVTNRTAPNQACMGELTIEFKDADHIVEKWNTIGSGQDHTAVFELTRKK